MNKIISITCTRCRQDLIHCRCNIPKPKKKAMENGELELSAKELEELEKIINFTGIDKIKRIVVEKRRYGHVLVIEPVDMKRDFLGTIEAIKYILERFDLF